MLISERNKSWFFCGFLIIRMLAHCCRLVKVKMELEWQTIWREWWLHVQRMWSPVTKEPIINLFFFFFTFCGGRGDKESIIRSHSPVRVVKREGDFWLEMGSIDHIKLRVLTILLLFCFCSPSLSFPFELF